MNKTEEIELRKVLEEEYKDLPDEDLFKVNIEGTGCHIWFTKKGLIDAMVAYNEFENG